MIFDGWEGVGRVLLVGTLAYIALVALLRVSGKRTLSKMNAFDFVLTVALGSTLATVLLNKEIALAEGLAAFVLIITLQAIITWLSVRFPRFQHLVKAAPRLVAYQGKVLEDALRAERLTREELNAALRDSGATDVAEVFAVVLETDGTLAVMPSKVGGHSALRGVTGFEQR